MTPAQYEWAVCIGRFQLFHDAQLALIQEGLRLAPRCAVLIGSAFQARSPRNPFTWQERADTIRLALPEDRRDRVVFAPLRDAWDEQRWVAAVQRTMARITGSDRTRVVMVGHRKDPTSEYLNEFPGWPLHDVGRHGEIHGKALRAALYAGPTLEASLAAMGGQVPPSTQDFLRSWGQLPFLPRLR
jgi:bifunctional NMN adenylyltransferase/nudix hydrolase